MQAITIALYVYLLLLDVIVSIKPNQCVLKNQTRLLCFNQEASQYIDLASSNKWKSIETTDNRNSYFKLNNERLIAILKEKKDTRFILKYFNLTSNTWQGSKMEINFSIKQFPIIIQNDKVVTQLVIIDENNFNVFYLFNSINQDWYKFQLNIKLQKETFFYLGNMYSINWERNSIIKIQINSIQFNEKSEDKSSGFPSSVNLNQLKGDLLESKFITNYKIKFDENSKEKVQSIDKVEFIVFKNQQIYLFYKTKVIELTMSTLSIKIIQITQFNTQDYLPILNYNEEGKNSDEVLLITNNKIQILNLKNWKLQDFQEIKSKENQLKLKDSKLDRTKEESLIKDQEVGFDFSPLIIILIIQGIVTILLIIIIIIIILKKRQQKNEQILSNTNKINMNYKDLNPTNNSIQDQSIYYTNITNNSINKLIKKDSTISIISELKSFKKATKINVKKNSIDNINLSTLYAYYQKE
ncbi:hypothetical protein K502DRAFT_367996 [Neoconidiobolus thromboides FSU 785]|nr:hypothetical protein K502DRAFT_367996 [Neoconidiobolus thromboides FSU 785]